MKLTYLSMLAFAVASCGTDDSKATDPKATDFTKGGVVTNPPNDTKKEVVVEYRKDGRSYSLAVNDTADLPACTHDNAKQLAWVKTTDQFFSCEDETWVQAPIASNTPVAAAVPTAPGDPGPKGESGAKGDKGDQGAKGDAGQPVSPNQWFDPITKQQWLIGNNTRQGILDNSKPCTDGWALGTRAQVKLAIQHGLSLRSVELGGAASVWTSEFRDTTTYRYLIDAGGSELDGYNNITAGIACLKG